MISQQIIATIIPPILVAVMIPIFRLYVRKFKHNWRIGWFLGLLTYWITWCGIGSWLLIGEPSIMRLIHPQRLTLEIVILLLIPLIGAGLYRFVPGMTYEKPQKWIFLLLVMTSFGNGFFEELLWRGVYMDLFPDNLFFGMIWPSLWFGLWHFAPGSVAPNRKAAGLMIGSGIMGLYLSFLARHTGTIWWTIMMHTIGGLIMIV